MKHSTPSVEHIYYVETVDVDHEICVFDQLRESGGVQAKMII